MAVYKAARMAALTVAVVAVSVPYNIDLATGGLAASTAIAGPGGGGAGSGARGNGAPGSPAGVGAGAAAEPAGPAMGHAAASANGNATAAAATKPNTTGLSKAEAILGTTPANESASDAASENQDHSIASFAKQMSKDAVAAVEAISQLFAGTDHEERPTPDARLNIGVSSQGVTAHEQGARYWSATVDRNGRTP